MEKQKMEDVGRFMTRVGAYMQGIYDFLTKQEFIEVRDCVGDEFDETGTFALGVEVKCKKDKRFRIWVGFWANLEFGFGFCDVPIWLFILMEKDEMLWEKAKELFPDVINEDYWGVGMNWTLPENVTIMEAFAKGMKDAEKISELLGMSIKDASNSELNNSVL